MKRRLIALSVVPALLLLVGCGEVEQAAKDAAGSAASGVANAAAEQVKGQICKLVEDGLVSLEDKNVLTGLVSAADTAGLPDNITKPLKEIAQAGDQAPEASVVELKKACEA
ncbi:hypothetical protein [Arthrobacter sp. ISL-30]|uniref:hypothetical protein n=1 Tax=Arthrobacter sp. ISL-30 TaxID=2819109 RepID=UPI001BE80F76|nr:hypothetical protein [Arthrobacter sp. ISL-30]MBT2512448.1 hypothetical protein [Arthrobacter sp. ISL-30]